MAVTEGLDYMPLEGRLGSAAMEGSSNGGVTPEGVRAGDRAALHALVDRRGPAVIAFCTQVCGPQVAERAAAEAFARFRAAVRDAPELVGLDPEALLRGATRHAAASMARVPSGPPPHGRLKSRGTKTCEHVPTMLAARANGALGEADLDRLARHMDRCERCDALSEIFRRAELSYQDPPVDTLGTDTSTVLVKALESVSEHGVGTAPAPGPDTPTVAPIEGAFGHLPDLDDEEPIEHEPVLVVEEIAEPAEELDAADLAAEPLPDEEPPLAGFDGLRDLDPGETVEWDELPAGPVAVDEHGAPAGPVAHAVAAPLLEGGHTRSRGPRPLLVVLPALLVAAVVAGALALSGVFGGDQPTPTVSHRPAPRVEAPVITPLPVTVKAPAAPSSAVPAGTTSAPGTTATTGPGATTATP
jgi:hypothetical protein